MKKMNQRVVLSIICAFLGLLMPMQEVEARRMVYCRFMWDTNPDGNYWWGDVTVSREVRNNEYNRLVERGWTKARAAKDAGTSCEFNHPENALIDIDVIKQRLIFDEAGRIPNCEDIKARVRCMGDRVKLSREPEPYSFRGPDGRKFK